MAFSSASLPLIFPLCRFPILPLYFPRCPSLSPLFPFHIDEGPVSARFFPLPRSFAATELPLPLRCPFVAPSPPLRCPFAAPSPPFAAPSLPFSPPLRHSFTAPSLPLSPPLRHSLTAPSPPLRYPFAAPSLLPRRPFAAPSPPLRRPFAAPGQPPPLSISHVTKHAQKSTVGECICERVASNDWKRRKSPDCLCCNDNDGHCYHYFSFLLMFVF